MGAAVIGTLLLSEFVLISGTAVGFDVTVTAFVVVRSSRPKISKATDGEGVLVVIHGGTIASG